MTVDPKRRLGQSTKSVVWGRMLLWAVHQSPFLSALQATDRLYGCWERVSPAAWAVAYRWMAAEMLRRGTDPSGRPPLWLWHSCDGWRTPPGRGTIGSLVNDLERQGLILTFDVPPELVLPSAYGPWNDLLDLCFEKGGAGGVLAGATKLGDRIFDISGLEGRRWRDGQYDVQACLPYLDRDWLVEVRPYDLDSTPSQGHA
jgi:hypothetical protein